jgi:hypothetical protein
MAKGSIPRWIVLVAVFGAILSFELRGLKDTEPEAGRRHLLSADANPSEFQQALNANVRKLTRDRIAFLDGPALTQWVKRQDLGRLSVKRNVPAPK